MDASAVTRVELRARLRACRRALSPAERIRSAERLAARLLALPFAPTSGYVAGYWAMDGEIALHAWQLGIPPACTYCLPVLHRDGTLRFAPWKPGQAVISNRFGIPEPDIDHQLLVTAEQLTMAVAPLVGFDRRGHRLGMGGGWYDRTFAFRLALPAPPWLVGAGFADQQVDKLDSAEWDVPLDAACTDSASFDFRQERRSPP